MIAGGLKKSGNGLQQNEESEDAPQEAADEMSVKPWLLEASEKVRWKEVEIRKQESATAQKHSHCPYLHAH